MEGRMLVACCLLLAEEGRKEAESRSIEREKIGGAGTASGKVVGVGKADSKEEGIKQ